MKNNFDNKSVIVPNKKYNNWHNFKVLNVNVREKNMYTKLLETKATAVAVSYIFRNFNS